MGNPRIGDRVVVTKGGKVVATAQNLEVLNRYHRQGGVDKRGIYHSSYIHPVSKSSATKLSNGEGLLRVQFTDGARVEVKFASFNVLKGWLNTKRKRSGWA